MAIRKITFDGSEVKSKDDADLYYHIFGLTTAGIIAGLYNECAVSAGNNQITISKGVIAVYGRMILVETNTQVSITLDGSKYGYVYLQVSTLDNSVSISTIESLTAYPSLTQNNLHSTSGIYQFPLARYTKTATSLTLDTSYQTTLIKTGPTLISEMQTTIQSYIESNFGVITLTPYSTASNISRYEITGITLAKCLFVSRLNNGTSIIFPGRTISRASLTNISYQYLQTNYYFIIEYIGPSTLYLYSSNNGEVGHRVSQLQIWR
ncbi:MAG: hypothetical protein WC286_03095 [Bacilli bacterium]|jgi:hypothetical protein